MSLFWNTRASDRRIGATSRPGLTGRFTDAHVGPVRQVVQQERDHAFAGTRGSLCPAMGRYGQTVASGAAPLQQDCLEKRLMAGQYPESVQADHLDERSCQSSNARHQAAPPLGFGKQAASSLVGTCIL